MADQEAYELAAARAAERSRAGTRARAGSQRVNRARIDVPSQSATAAKLGYPLAIAGLWVFIYLVFIRPAEEARKQRELKGGGGSLRSIPVAH